MVSPYSFLQCDVILGSELEMTKPSKEDADLFIKVYNTMVSVDDIKNARARAFLHYTVLILFRS